MSICFLNVYPMPPEGSPQDFLLFSTCLSYTPPRGPLMISLCGPGPEIPSIMSPKDPLRGKCTQRSLEGGRATQGSAQSPGARVRTQSPEEGKNTPPRASVKGPCGQGSLGKSTTSGAQSPCPRAQWPRAHVPVAQSPCPKAQWGRANVPGPSAHVPRPNGEEPMSQCP